MNKSYPSNRKSARRWNLFFGESGIVKRDKAAKPTVSVFLGFHTSDAEPYIRFLTNDAKSKGYMVIIPSGSYYNIVLSREIVDIL